MGEYLTSNSVSLNSYENRLGLKSSKVELLGTMPHLKGIGKKNVKRSKGDKKSNNQLDDVPDNSDIEVAESTVGYPTEKVTASSSTEKPAVEQSVGSSGFPGRESVERIRQGWNVEEANTITVGDLFLMVNFFHITFFSFNFYRCSVIIIYVLNSLDEIRKYTWIIGGNHVNVTRRQKKVV